ncbi:MAG: hypothetical protein P8188_18390, partial [Gemmatimonadota bacterium]
ISLLRGGPGFVAQSEWGITRRPELLHYAPHAVDSGMVDQVIGDVRTSSPQNAQLLSRLGLNFAQAEERQFVWWLIDAHFIRNVSPANAIPARIQVARRARQFAHVYRDRLRSRYRFFGQFDPSARADDINLLERAVTAALATYRWDAIDVETGRSLARRIRSGREPAVQRVLEQPAGPGTSFQDALTFAQYRFDDRSIIEIKGCRIGGNRAYLEGISRFFGGGTSNPTVKAPDLFQIFGWMGQRPHRDNTRYLRGLWRRRAVRDAFVYWAQESGWALSQPPVADDLVNALRAGHAFPVGATLHYLRGRDPGNVAAWYARFGYAITRAPDVEQTFFTGRSTVRGIRYTLIDWLQDRRFRQRPRVILFPPDPAYSNHIQSVRAAPAGQGIFL